MERWGAAEPARKDAAATKMKELVGLIAKLQKRSGVWQHEYDNPFATASTLVALAEAKAAGAEVPDDVLARGTRALEKCRSAKGIFSYAYGWDGSPVLQSAGRMPLCELGLFLNGKSDEAALRAAVDAGFERHDALERVRKYDNHADAVGNGGFFFWYDMVGRAEAIRRLKADRAKLLERQRDLVLSIAEIDGTFVDSHELGKSYGTAMALLTLRLCGE